MTWRQGMFQPPMVPEWWLRIPKAAIHIRALQRRTTASYSRSVWIHLGEW